MKKLISWNVNGIRAAVTKGFFEFITRENPDIIWLQEVKATEDQNPIRLELESLGYHIFWNSAEKKWYSGTAIFTKEKPISIAYGMGILEHDNEWRIITAEYTEYFFVTVYTPNSKDDLSRLQYRTVWDKEFLIYINSLEAKKPVIFCGDLNVAHKEIDLANPRANIGEHGFTIEERTGFQGFIDAGYIDTFRHFYPETERAYTWWSHFANSRARNVWWRIDYFLISHILHSRLRGAFIQPEQLGSDHCPVGIMLDI